MRLFTSKIFLVLFFITLLALIDIFNDVIELFRIKGDGLIARGIDVGAPLLGFLFIIWALFLIRKVISQIDSKEIQNRNLIELSPEAIFVHCKGELLYTNNAGVKLLGLENKVDVLNRNLIDFIHPNNKGSFKFLIGNPLFNKENMLTQYVKGKRMDGTIFDMEITSSPIEYNGQPAEELIARDITIQKQKNDMLERFAYIDALTDLPNRRGFTDKLKQTVDYSKKYNTIFGLMFIDLDGFKKVNDILGHEKGDLLLKQVSLYLNDCIKGKDLVARFGGDEFTILLPGVNRNDCAMIAKRIIEDFSISIDVQNVNVRVTPSIGISMYPDDGNNVETLLDNADKAMYQAKNNGKNNYQFYKAVRQ